MKAIKALRELAEITASQWGMATSAQASAQGVSRLDLSRLTRSGDLTRLAHGIYMDSGVPSGAYLDVRAAWLSSDPAQLADDRLKQGCEGVTVCGQTAAWLHDIGDFRSQRTELSTPLRRQTQRADIHYRHRALSDRDITVHDGLPVTTVERTLADLVEDRTDLSLVADALRDATANPKLDLENLEENLAPLAERNGHRKGNGTALLEQLLTIAELDSQSVAKQIASIDNLGKLVALQYLTPRIDDFPSANLAAMISKMASITPMDPAVISAFRGTPDMRVTHRIKEMDLPAIVRQIETLYPQAKNRVE